MCILQKFADKLQTHDQYVLNIAFSDKKVILPLKYNMHGGFLRKCPIYDYKKYEKEVEQARKDPVIVHFIEEKPWNSYSRQPKNPFSSTFFKYQSQTKWKGAKIDKRPFKLRVVNYVADMLRKYGLKSPVSPSYEYIEIPPVD
jgi:lipopolysaccharide biosynthesis glycosyltransferase